MRSRVGFDALAKHRSKGHGEDYMSLDNNAAKSTILNASSAANNDSLTIIPQELRTPEQTIQQHIANGELHLASIAIRAMLEKNPRGRFDLPLSQKRVLLDGGYYSLVRSMDSAEATSAIASLAGFMSGQRTLSQREVRQQISKAPTDFDEVLVTAQLCSVGAVFGVLPRSLMDDSVDLLSALCSRLESSGDLHRAAEAYLRLGSIMAVKVAKGCAISRALFKHANDIAPTAALRSEAAFRGVEATFLAIPASARDLINGLDYLVDGTVAVGRLARSHLILRLAQTLLKVSSGNDHDRGIQYIEHAVRLAENLGDNATVFQGLLTLIENSIPKGDSYNTNQLLIAAEKVSDSMGFPLGGLSCHISRLHLMISQGERDLSRAAVKRLADISRALPGGLAYALPISLYCEQLGMHDESDALRNWAHGHFKRIESWTFEAGTLQTQADSYASRGDHKRAVATYSKLERLYRKRGDEAKALEVKVISLQTQLAVLAESLGGESKRNRHSNILKQARQVLGILPSNSGEYLRGKLAQIEGHMLFLAKRYQNSQIKLSEARNIFQSIGNEVDAAFVNGLLGLVQFEAARKDSGLQAETLMLAESNLVSAARALHGHRIRRESTKMWKMAAMVSLERIRRDAERSTGNDTISDAGPVNHLDLKRNCELYLDMSWSGLLELESMSCMDELKSAGDKAEKRQLVKVALEIAHELYELVDEGESILEKWLMREELVDQSLNQLLM
jgi:tetratricopeptide (TPR) repeat protein